MYKALKNSKIIAINDTGDFPCLVYDEIVEDITHSCKDYVHYKDEFILIKDVPAPTMDEIRQLRQQAFTEEADPLKYDWEEASARYGTTSPQAIQTKNTWLLKKDEIRQRYPYPTN